MSEWETSRTRASGRRSCGRVAGSRPSLAKGALHPGFGGSGRVCDPESGRSARQTASSVPEVTEKQAYEVVRSYDQFELRRYAPHVVAEVVVRAPFEDAGNIAFRMLLGYISGENRSASKVPMTAPVVQRESEKIHMTEPVEQRETREGEYAVAFVLPASFTLDRAPVPTSPEVHLHERQAVLSAARQYRGRWSKASYEHHLEALDRAIRAAGLTPVGSAKWARFDPPFVPWFLRRNEVVQDVEVPESGVISG